MKEKKENEKKKPRNERRFYLMAAIASACVLVALVIVAIAVGGKIQIGEDAKKPNSSVESPTESDPNGDEPVIITPEGMIAPVVNVAILNQHGFYYNKTLDHYHEHFGMDFTAEVGAEVKAVEDGIVESIYKDDLLCGTEIVVNHGDGLKSVYRFVNEAAGVKVGDSVTKGDVIATVAEANGDEYKEGAHLHFEILKDGKSVDPTTYLTLEEK